MYKCKERVRVEPARYGESADILAREENGGGRRKGQEKPGAGENLPGISAFQERIGSGKHRGQLG